MSRRCVVRGCFYPGVNLPNVMVLLCTVCILLSTLGVHSAEAQSSLQKQVDSLFVIASSGEVMNRDMVEPATQAIVDLGVDAVPILIDKFTTKSARERLTVVNILTRIGSPAVPDLVRALGRPEALVVQRVCWALGDIKDTAAVMPLINVADHAEWQVRDQSIGALGKIGDQRGADAVAAALGDTIGQVRKAAAVSAGQLSLRQSAERLVGLLGDDFYGARLSAYNSLLGLDTNLVLGILKDSLESERPLVGNLGCRLLGEFGTDRALEILLRQTSSLDPDRRAHAAIAIVNADPLDNCDYRRLFIPEEPDRLVLLKIHSAIQAAEEKLVQSEDETGQP